MKSERAKFTTSDRLATSDEVRRATSTAPDHLLELWAVDGNYCQMNSDLGGVIRYAAEEFEFFAYLSDLDETMIN